jgi:hypothetical protein
VELFEQSSPLMIGSASSVTAGTRRTAIPPSPAPPRRRHRKPNTWRTRLNGSAVPDARQPLAQVAQRTHFMGRTPVPPHSTINVTDGKRVWAASLRGIVITIGTDDHRSTYAQRRIQRLDLRHRSVHDKTRRRDHEGRQMGSVWTVDLLRRRSRIVVLGVVAQVPWSSLFDNTPSAEARAHDKEARRRLRLGTGWDSLNENDLGVCAKR